MQLIYMKYANSTIYTYVFTENMGNEIYYPMAVALKMCTDEDFPIQFNFIDINDS